MFIYLDFNATTPLDNRVLEEMLPYFTQSFGNASSNYSFGNEAKKAVDIAKIKVADLLNVEPKEILFTSGTTESLNLALKGLALHPSSIKKHIITCQTEHKAVLETCLYLESVGFEIDYLPVNREGVVDLEILKSTIKKETLLICLMWVNNETGVTHPINEIGKIAKEHGVYFVCDGTQGVGKLPLDLSLSNIDILCFSSHKMYGPKGIGGIYINSQSISQNKIQPLIHGGGQENGLRSGTYNVPLIVGLGKACQIAKQDMSKSEVYIKGLKSYLERELLQIQGAMINGNSSTRIYNTTNVYVPNLDTEVFIGINKDIAISNGSACTSALIQPSHVLLAMGLNNEEAMSSIRISMGLNNTVEDITILLDRIRNFTSFYEMPN